MDGVVCKTPNSQLPTKSPTKLMENTNLHILKTENSQYGDWKIIYVIDARWTDMKWSMRMHSLHLRYLIKLGAMLEICHPRMRAPAPTNQYDS